MNLDLSHDLPEQLPAHYREILDYQQICNAEETAFSQLEGDTRRTLDNFFVQTADEPTLSLWEKTFHIVSNPDSEPLDYRRQRILNRIAMQPPFTLTFLYGKLDQLIGAGKWDCTVDYPAYTLSVRSRAENQLYYSELAALIQIIKPAHIAFVNVPMFTTGVLISETIQQQSYVNNYRLGSWALGTVPFRSVKDIATIKAEQTPSVKPALLAHIADDIRGMVKMLSAGEIRTNEIRSTISPASMQNGESRYLLAGRELLMEAQLPYSATESCDVTCCRLLNSEDAVLFSSPCFFPVKTQTAVQVRCAILEDASFAQTQDGALIPVTTDKTGAEALQDDLLSALSASTAALIENVQINGNEISAVRTSQEGSTVTVEYSVSVSGSARQRCSLALLDVSGNVLTQAQAALSDAVFTTVRHTLRFKEGTLRYGR